MGYSLESSSLSLPHSFKAIIIPQDTSGLMNCRIEEIETFGRKLYIEIPAADFNERVNAKLRKLALKAKIKGFRPGKAPMEIVKRYYGEEVESDATVALIHESYKKALEQHSFFTLSAPSFDDVEVDQDIGIKYTAYIEVLPDLQLTYENITIEKPVCEITEADVDAMVEQVRKNNPKWQVKDGAACVDDRVTINISTPETGNKPIFENKSYILGSKPMGEYFDRQVENMRAGEEKKFDFSGDTDQIPADSNILDTQYTVHLKLVEKPILHEVDDDFFKACGIEEGGLDAFRSALLEGMEAQAKRKISQLHRTNVENAMLTHSNIKAPPAVLREEIEKIKKNLAEDDRNYSDKDISDELIEKIGKRLVCLNILFTYIHKKNNFKADRNACEAKIDELARDYKEPNRVRSYYRSNANAYRKIEDMVFEDKVIDHVAKEAKVSKKEYPFYELMDMEKTQ